MAGGGYIVQTHKVKKPRLTEEQKQMLMRMGFLSGKGAQSLSAFAKTLTPEQRAMLKGMLLENAKEWKAFADTLTQDQLMAIATVLRIPGAESMTEAQLRKAIRKAIREKIGARVRSHKKKTNGAFSHYGSSVFCYF